MLVSFEGRMGQGKSAAAVGLAVAEQKLNGRNIYSTAHLFSAIYCQHCQPLLFEESLLQRKHRVYPPPDSWYFCDTLQVKLAVEEDDQIDEIAYTYINLKGFYEIVSSANQGEIELSQGIFLLDESYLFMDARTSSSKINRIFNDFTFQTRKRGIDLYLTTHDVMRLDKRIRAAIDLKVNCRYNGESQMITLRVRDMHTGVRRRLKLWGPEAAFPYYETDEMVRPQGKIYRMTIEELT